MNAAAFMHGTEEKRLEHCVYSSTVYWCTWIDLSYAENDITYIRIAIIIIIIVYWP